ncbi:MAG: tetratricopeptide repeat protein [Verrucomicrobia bacterium]|nr:tetratricopeptide repeat protein [Verrucomicrobiota bacterium]
MMPGGPGSWRRSLLILAVLWMVAFSLACRLAPRQANVTPTGTDSAVGRVLGVSRVAFGQSFYVGADDFFHRGVARQYTQVFTNRLFQRWGAAIRPSGHIHTEGYSVSEIIPWLRMATTADPENVEAFLTMAYWLTRLNRLDAAEQVLREAQRLHPRDFRLLGERGRLAFRQGRDEQAAGLTEAALRVWPNPLAPDDEEARLEKARLWSLRAVMYEIRGEADPAAKAFREALRLMPQNEGIRRHLDLLQSGQVEATLARDYLDHLFPMEHVCDREDHEHEH